MRRFALPSVLMALLILTGIQPALAQDEDDRPDPAPAGAAKRCIRHARGMARRCARRNHRIAKHQARVIRRLVAAGDQEAAEARARRCANRIENKTNACANKIREHCNKCKESFEQAGHLELAARVARACDRILHRLNKSKEKALFALIIRPEGDQGGGGEGGE